MDVVVWIIIAALVVGVLLLLWSGRRRGTGRAGPQTSEDATAPGAASHREHDPHGNW